MRVALAGGITGGHLFPLICVGEALQQQGHQVLFIGARHGLEARLALPFPALLLEMSGLRPAARRPWRVPLTLWRASREAKRALQQFNADLLFCTGGYGSVPVAAAQRARRKPLILLEPDAMPGRANRWLARWARAICLNFEEAAPISPPIRPPSARGCPPAQASTARRWQPRRRESISGFCPTSSPCW
jgi:UDP-N-acetylglucosamine--N-acetylmuramyl-(pentapeptide) pyrophosphoryl-undecaprenol N-acetylglucosamine transferase